MKWSYQLFSTPNISGLVRSLKLKLGYKMQTGINIQKMQKKNTKIEIFGVNGSHQTTTKIVHFRHTALMLKIASKIMLQLHLQH